jgi:hypothetical protein
MIMRGWRSAFLFGGLAAALVLAGCSVAPIEGGDDPGEQVEEVASDLDFDAPADDPGGDGADQADPSPGESDEEPDPIPWKPDANATAASASPGPSPEDREDPDPIPWTFRGSEKMDSHTDSETTASKP